MHKKHKYDIIALLALVNFAITFYLSVTHYLGYAVPCTITHGCEVVLNSQYSVMLGIPLPVWGVAYATAVIFCALMANHYAVWRKILTIILGLGALASLGFLSIQFFILKRICQYCLTTDLLNILIFIFDINIEHKKQIEA